jgi:hypothetical protein
MLELLGLTSRPMLLIEGTNACSSSSRFGATSMFMLVTPVTLPPGRFRLASPSSTGSAATPKTIGTAAVAALAAIAEGVPPATAITDT